MNAPQKIVLKLTGSILLDRTSGKLSTIHIAPIIEQIKKLRNTYQIGIVIGGSSFFRGNQQGKALGLTSWAGHTVGMLATVMNGLILKDLMVQANIATTLLSAVDFPNVVSPISQLAVETALSSGNCIIFSGGTGLPYFTTDTNAVIRALQMGASQVWKCTNVDGIYDSDPAINPHAQLLSNLSFKEALEKKLHIMDMTAFTLAQEYNLNIRILNVFKNDSLVNAAQNPNFGSLIHP